MTSRRVREECHLAAFRGIPISCMREINAIHNNDPDTTHFCCPTYATLFPTSAWDLLSRYIAGNDFLSSIDLSSCGLTDSKISALFIGLAESGRSLQKLELKENEIGVGGIRGMLPFLRRSHENIKEIDLSNNDVSTEGFELLVNALNGGSIKILCLEKCNIKSIVALESCTLPNLRSLDLSDNELTSISPLENFTQLERLDFYGSDIGENGHIIIAKLLQNEESNMTHLEIEYTGMGDEEAEILANSLKCNTKLQKIEMEGNPISSKGFGAFLKLFNDISSIESY